MSVLLSYKAGGTSLYHLYCRDVLGSRWIPHTRGILDRGSDKCLVTGVLDVSRKSVDDTLQKGSGVAGLLSDIGYVGDPGYLAVDGDAHMLRTANLPRDSAVDGVVTVYPPLPPVSNLYYLTFIPVKLYQPVSFPLL